MIKNSPNTKQLHQGKEIGRNRILEAFSKEIAIVKDLSTVSWIDNR